jgi:hypothetical protein
MDIGPEKMVVLYRCPIRMPSSKPLRNYFPPGAKSSGKGARSDHPTCVWPLMLKGNAFFWGKWDLYDRMITAHYSVAYSPSGL